jgi:hypothetical protein
MSSGVHFFCLELLGGAVEGLLSFPEDGLKERVSQDLKILILPRVTAVWAPFLVQFSNSFVHCCVIKLLYYQTVDVIDTCDSLIGAKNLSMLWVDTYTSYL